MGLSLQERIAKELSPAERAAWLATVDPDLLEQMKRQEWWWTARPEQVPPPGDWSLCLILAGRGFGKSKLASEWIVQRVLDHPVDRHGFRTEWLYIAQTLSDAKHISIEGSAGVLRILERRKIPYKYVRHPKPTLLVGEAGSCIFFEGADGPDVGRGYNAAGAVLDEICIAQGELVVTRRGSVPVEDVLVGDEVATRRGWRTVSHSGLTRRAARIVRLVTSAGEVRVTGDHRVWVRGRGWVAAENVVVGDSMDTCLPQMNTPIQWPAQPPLSTSGMAKSGTSTSAPVTITTAMAPYSTGQYGPKSMDLSPMTTRSTTSIEIDQTICWPILNASPSVDTASSPPMSGPTRHGLRGAARERHADSCGTGVSVSQSILNVSSVEQYSSRLGCEPNTASLSVEMPSMPHSRPTLVLSVVKESLPADVYDITVDGDAPEFFAGSGALLVHNCKWKHSKESWYEGIMPSLRADLIDDHPRTLVATTPKPIELLREWSTRADGSVHVIRGSTFDNAANLNSHTLEELKRRYAGTLTGRQELYGELLDGRDGALWGYGDIDNNRVTHIDEVEFTHLTVGVDPTLTEDGDLMGVVVVGRDRNNHMFVLADESVPLAGRPAATHIWQVFYRFGADTVVIEENLAKKWMKDVLTDAYKELRDQDNLFPPGTTPPLKGVDARLGKKLRAEPVAMRYEQNTVHHHGIFTDLENEMLNFDPTDSHNSPNRMDALVHACRHLMQGEKRRIRVSSSDALWSKVN